MKFSDLLNESIVVHGVNLFAYVVTVGEAFDALPVFDKAAVPAWEALIQSDTEWYNRLVKKISFEFTQDNPVPSTDDKEFQELMNDILVKKHLAVFKTKDSTHPVLKPSENDIFRAVHDVLGHGGGNSQRFLGYMLKKAAGEQELYQPVQGSGFKMRGEMNTFLTQSKLIPAVAVPALFVESVGQACYLFVSGEYAPNKVGLIDDVDYKSLGMCYNDLKARMDDIVAQYHNPAIEAIQTTVNGISIQKSSINWEKLSRGTAAGNIT